MKSWVRIALYELLVFFFLSNPGCLVSVEIMNQTELLNLIFGASRLFAFSIMFRREKNKKTVAMMSFMARFLSLALPADPLPLQCARSTNIMKVNPTDILSPLNSYMRTERP